MTPAAGTKTETRPFITRWRDQLAYSNEDANTKHVGQAMSLRMSSTGKGCSVSLETLMAMTSLSESAVKRARRRLVSARWVTRTVGGGRGNTNVYDATFPSLQEGGLVEPVPTNRVSKQAKPGLSDPVSTRKGGLAIPERGSQQNGNGVSQTPEVVTNEVESEVELLGGRGRKRDPIWDAVIEACGIEPTEITEHQRGGIAKAVTELKRVGATPQKIRDRAVVYRQRFDGAALTPPALAKHWSTLGRAPSNVSTDVNGAKAFLEAKGIRVP